MRRAATIACGAASAGVITAAWWVAATPMAGCSTRQCDPITVSLPRSGGCPLGINTTLPSGEILWQSSPNEGPWLDFPGQRTYVLTYPQPFAGPPTVSCYVAADVNHPQNNFVECGGNLAQFIGNVPADAGIDSADAPDAGVDGAYVMDAGVYRSIVVVNPGCAGYGLQVVARGIPAGPPSSNDVGCDASP